MCGIPELKKHEQQIDKTGKGIFLNFRNWIDQTKSWVIIP